MKELLKINNLHERVGEKEILKGLNLTINNGETHVIMGPDGSGKTTLANVILNNPIYKKTAGEIIFNGTKINDMKTDEIARSGIFMSFQLPEEIPGISVMNFLKYAKNKTTGEPVKVFKFKEQLESYMEELKIDASYANIAPGDKFELIPYDGISVAPKG